MVRDNTTKTFSFCFNGNRNLLLNMYDITILQILLRSCISLNHPGCNFAFLSINHDIATPEVDLIYTLMKQSSRRLRFVVLFIHKRRRRRPVRLSLVIYNVQRISPI